MTAPDLSVLLVTYNSADFIGDCLDGLAAACATHSYEVVVADNASGDGSAALVRRDHPDVTVLDMGANLGFSRANNAALAASTGRHVLLLNGDATCAPGSLDLLVDRLDADPTIGVVAPGLRNPDGTDQGTARSFPTPAAAIFGRRSPVTRAFPRNRWSARYLHAGERSATEPFDVDWVSGACLMIPRSVIDEVGPLDGGFFMYWEDADWCRRVKATGRRVVAVPTAEVVHAEGGSSRGLAARQAWHFHRSAYRYYAKHHATGRRAPLRPVAGALLGARLALVLARHRIAAGRRSPDQTRAPGTPGVPVHAR